MLSDHHLPMEEADEAIHKSKYFINLIEGYHIHYEVKCKHSNYSIKNNRHFIEIHYLNDTIINGHEPTSNSLTREIT